MATSAAPRPALRAPAVTALGALASVAVAAAVALAFGGHAFLNYDTTYAVLWGRDLANGTLPDLGVALAPTPHPLATVASIVLREEAWIAVAYLSLGAVAVLVAALGGRWFGWPAGVLAAAIFVTREPVLSFGLRAYLDLPYLALVLGALLVEARRPRAGAPVLVMLALAGLLRPEAWLFSAAYLAWLWLGGRREAAHVALTAAAPVLWSLFDLLVTGDPLHSLLGTRENADVLGRVTGLDDVPVTMPRRLGEILREPVLLGAAGGGLIALAWKRRETLLPAAAGLVAIAAFLVLAGAGLPILARYLLLPAAILAIFCGAGVLGWLTLPAGDARRRPWAAFGGLVAVLLVAFAPAQADRLDRLERSLAVQERILDDLEALPAGALRCRPLAVPNRRPVPHLALWFGVDPADVLVGDVGRARTYVGPSSRAVAEDFIFDRRDPVRVLPRLPATFERVAGNRSWTVWSACPPAPLSR